MQRERQNKLAKQGREKKKVKETWWVELQKHYMSAQDHQDVLFDQAKKAEETERVEKMMEANDIMKGRKTEKKFDMSEHMVEEEDEDQVELSKKTSRKRSTKQKEDEESGQEREGRGQKQKRKSKK